MKKRLVETDTMESLHRACSIQDTPEGEHTPDVQGKAPYPFALGS